MEPFKIDSPDYSRLKARGQNAYNRMIREIRQKGRTYVPPMELAPFYTTDVPPADMAMLPDEVKPWIAENGCPLNGYSLVGVHNVPNPGEPLYNNYIHESGSAILCMSNFKENDVQNGQPGQMFFSDLLAASCCRVMAAQEPPRP